MTKFNTIFCIFILSAVLGAVPQYGKSIPIKKIKSNEYILLNELITSCNLETSFDLITQKGKLYYKSHSAAYIVDYSLMIIDGRIFRSSQRVIRDNGAIMVPLDMSIAIIDSFFHNVTHEKKKKKLVLLYEQKKAETHDENTQNTIKSGDDKIRFIVIDPGHGGKDPGAVGKGGKKEKDITLEVAKNVERELKKRFKNIQIIITRRKDQFIELVKRTDLANKLLKKNENGVFLSIHVNATLSSFISGFETYYLSQNPSNDEARNTAALENNVIVLEDRSKHKSSYDDIDYIEATMLTTQIQKESHLLAQSIQRGMARGIGNSKSRGVKKADFFVLRGVLMPAVLIEVGFITNKKEAKLLSNKSYQKKVSLGIAWGVADFINKYNSLIK